MKAVVSLLMIVLGSAAAQAQTPPTDFEVCADVVQTKVHESDKVKTRWICINKYGWQAQFAQLGALAGGNIHESDKVAMREAIIPYATNLHECAAVASANIHESDKLNQRWLCLKSVPAYSLQDCLAVAKTSIHASDRDQMQNYCLAE